MGNSVIVSSSNGRVRIRNRYIKYSAISDILEINLKRTNGIFSLTINRRGGSILIHYDPRRIDLKKILKIIETNHILPEEDEAIDPRLRGPLDLINTALIRPRNQKLRTGALNAGMLLTLGLSMFALTVKHKKAHQIWGYLFLASNAIHVLKYKRRLLSWN